LRNYVDAGAVEDHIRASDYHLRAWVETRLDRHLVADDGTYIDFFQLRDQLAVGVLPHDVYRVARGIVGRPHDGARRHDHRVLRLDGGGQMKRGDHTDPQPGVGIWNRRLDIEDSGVGIGDRGDF